MVDDSGDTGGEFKFDKRNQRRAISTLRQDNNKEPIKNVLEKKKLKNENYVNKLGFTFILENILAISNSISNN